MFCISSASTARQATPDAAVLMDYSFCEAA